MIVVADASPLIFLAKLRHLPLLTRLLGHDIRLPTLIRDELLAGCVDPVEERELGTFLGRCTVETVRRPRRFASAMSEADNAALTLAIRRRADILLCDERTVRLMAEAEGIRPLGTLGVLLRAMRRGFLSPPQTRRLVDLLIAAHGFRIGIDVYQSVLVEIEREPRRRSPEEQGRAEP